MLTRRQWIGAGAATALTAQAKRPNIVLIMTVQQSISALSAAGNPYVSTPNMDRLAAEGMRFENSWCASPVCGPARSSLVTGCYPTTSGVVYNGDSINRDVPTLGEVLQSAGYETAWAGKWHLPGPYPGARVAGREALAGQRGIGFVPFPMQQTGQLAFGDFTDEPVAASAAEFLKRDHLKPFFLGVSVHNPHDICYWVMDKLPPGHPARAEFDVAVSKLPPVPRNHAVSPEEPDFIAMCRRRKVYGPENTYTTDWDELRWRRYLYGYYRMTERVDKTVGAVLSALRDTGQEKDTLVVFTSDHGEGMSAHHWVVKLMLWHEVVSVPLTRPVHGSSLGPVLLGKAQKTASSLFAQLAPDTSDHHMQGRAVRTERYKYVRFSKGSRPEMLFDLKRDPGETRNLVACI